MIDRDFYITECAVCGKVEKQLWDAWTIEDAYEHAERLGEDLWEYKLRNEGDCFDDECVCGRCFETIKKFFDNAGRPMKERISFVVDVEYHDPESVAFAREICCV